MRFIIFLLSSLGQLIGYSQRIGCGKKSGNAHPAAKGKYDTQTTGYQVIAGAVPREFLNKTSRISASKRH
jgi:hypothetical protein